MSISPVITKIDKTLSANTSRVHAGLNAVRALAKKAFSPVALAA